MAEAIIIIGGNLGDTGACFEEARRLIARDIGAILKSSGVYKSCAWGFQAEREFSNQVIVVDTALSSDELLEAIHKIESCLGRNRAAEQAEKELTGERYSSRTIDIDILFYDDLVKCTDNLTIPHPLIQERGFVLEPLREAAPEKIHPQSGKSVAALYDELKERNKA